MRENKVISVDIVNGPIGGYGSHAGYWTATTEDGRKFRFFHSLAYREGPNEDHLIEIAEAALKRGMAKWI